MLDWFLGAVGCGDITSLAAVEEETVDVSQRGELTFGQGVRARGVGYAWATLCIPPRPFALGVFSVRLHEGDGTFPELGGCQFPEVLTEAVDRAPELPDLFRSEILTQETVHHLERLTLT
jgi:hypothetical protein